MGGKGLLYPLTNSFPSKDTRQEFLNLLLGPVNRQDFRLKVM